MATDIGTSRSLRGAMARCAGRPARAIAFLGAVLCAGPAVLAAAGVADVGAPLTEKALPSRLASRSLMLDVARAGDRLVAVGERGRVLISDDSGKTWRQSRGVPVSVTLTALTFADARNGWATGHAGVVLHTADAGNTWELQLDGTRAAALAAKALGARPADDPLRRVATQWVADGPDKPFLALEFTSARNGTVVGAYGLIFSTDDGGATWVSRLADVDNPGGLHLNAIRTVGAYTFIAGEKGLLLRSGDAGRFAALGSPYDGSWFALDALPSGGGGVVVAGLRGHAYGSEDAGASWHRIDGTGAATLGHASRVGNDLLLLVDQGGAVLALNGGGRLVALALPPLPPVTSLAVAADGSVVAATVRGPVRLPLDLAAVALGSGSR